MEKTTITTYFTNEAALFIGAPYFIHTTIILQPLLLGSHFDLAAIMILNNFEPVYLAEDFYGTYVEIFVKLWYFTNKIKPTNGEFNQYFSSYTFAHLFPFGSTRTPKCSSECRNGF